MNATAPQTHSPGYYRFVEFCRRVWVYVLLIVGTIIFAWPFLWMATTSVKVDREMFVEQMHVWPQRPIPQVKSPYIDTRYYSDVTGKHLEELLPVLEAHLQKMDYPWPPEIDRTTAIKQVARGAFQKLENTMPVTIWESTSLVAEATQRVDVAMVGDVLGQIRRACWSGNYAAARTICKKTNSSLLIKLPVAGRLMARLRRSSCKWMIRTSRTLSCATTSRTAIRYC